MSKRKSQGLIAGCLTWNYLNRVSYNETLPRRSWSRLNSSVTRKTDEDNIPHQGLRARILPPDWYEILFINYSQSLSPLKETIIIKPTIELLITCYETAKLR